MQRSPACRNTSGRSPRSSVRPHTAHGVGVCIVEI
jgi:hypothetical protein